MVPSRMLACPIAAVGISSIYAIWNRYYGYRSNQSAELRSRIAFMLWIAANRVHHEGFDPSNN